MSQDGYPFAANNGRGGTTLLYPPSFFASTADARPSVPHDETHAAGVHLPARGPTPLTNVTLSMLSAPEETNEEEAERLRDENARLKEEVERLGCGTGTKDALPLQPWPVLASGSQTIELLECKLKLLEREKEQLLTRTLNAEQSLLAIHQQHRVEVDTLRAECEKLVLSLREQYQNAVEQTHQQCQGLAEQLGRIQRVKEGLHQQLREKEQECQSVSVELAESTKLRERELSAVRKNFSQQEDRVATLERDLTAKGVHVQSVEACLVEEKRKVEHLLTYVGVGAVEDLTNEISGITWQQERDQLRQQNQTLQEENSRLMAESELLQVRVDSLDQIMALQEAELAKSSCKESKGKSLSSAQVSSLLAGWRGKVFELLVKLKLWQIEQDRMKHSLAKKEQFFSEEMQKFSQENEVLSLALKAEEADKQLQVQKTQEAVAISNHTLSQKAKLECWLNAQQKLLHSIGQNVREMGVVPGRMEALVRDVISPRLIITESRLARNGRRLQAIIASLNSWYVTCKNPSIPLARSLCHTTTQTEDVLSDSGTEVEDVAVEADDLESMSVERLVCECRVLMKERDLLTRRLTEATATFQHQLEADRKEDTERIGVLDQRVERLTGERSSLAEQLSECRSQLEETSAESTRLHERCLLLEENLEEIGRERDDAVEQAVREEQWRGAEERIKLEQCVEVARREQGKMAAELQQVQRRAARETERAVQAVTISKEQVEYELDVCRRKLHSLQVERNLLMSTLRQEGIKLDHHSSGRLEQIRPLPFSLSPPRQEDDDSNTDSDSSSEDGRTDLSLSRSAPRLLRWTRPKSISPCSPSSPQGPPSLMAADDTSQPSPPESPDSQPPQDDEESNKENVCMCTVNPTEDTLKLSPIRPRVEKEISSGAAGKDPQLMTTQGMHEVLRDLQQLSAALLSMDNAT